MKYLENKINEDKTEEISNALLSMLTWLESLEPFTCLCKYSLLLVLDLVLDYLVYFKVKNYIIV